MMIYYYRYSLIQTFSPKLYPLILPHHRYPPDAYKKELALGDKDKGRKDEKSIEELIKEMEDEYEE
jgi:hypothetical protein